MCGIVGVIGQADSSQGQACVQRMNDAIIHRGPDDQGVYATQNVAFGMRRLSIIDLSNGHQPMWTGARDGEGIGIVFNGEIYNYRELRADLTRQGVQFRTDSDTEVILRLYEREGLSFISRLNGMFAICIYDPAEQKVHLVRDRLGIKPVYYTHQGQTLYFASEIKCLIAGLEKKPPLNKQSLYHYLTLRYVPDPDTIWQGIEKLKPGHRLTYDLQTKAVSQHAYWSVDFHSEEIEPGRDYMAEFEELFLSAVDMRLVAADVPVGVLLSGGLDSSAVSAAAVELGHKSFNTFSVAFEDGGSFSELKYAREVSEHLGSTHHEIVIGQKEFMDTLPEMVAHLDEPVADLASIPLYHVSKLARERVKVVLSGEGSDEILAGYDMEKVAARLQQLKRIPGWLAGLAGKFMSGPRAETFNILAQSGWSDLLKAREAYISKVWSQSEKDAFWQGEIPAQSSEDIIRSWYQISSSPHPLDQMQQAYCCSWLVEDLLMKADKMSMAHSLELRVPFLDYRLVEWASKLPLDHKVGNVGSGWVSKKILRDFSRKRLPSTILDRPKQGFPVPAYLWLEDDLGTWAEDRLIYGYRLKDYFDQSCLKPVMAAARNGDRQAQHKVWSLLIFDQWLETVKEG